MLKICLSTKIQMPKKKMSHLRKTKFVNSFFENFQMSCSFIFSRGIGGHRNTLTKTPIFKKKNKRRKDATEGLGFRKNFSQRKPLIM